MNMSGIMDNEHVWYHGQRTCLVPWTMNISGTMDNGHAWYHGKWTCLVQWTMNMSGTMENEHVWYYGQWTCLIPWTKCLIFEVSIRFVPPVYSAPIFMLVTRFIQSSDPFTSWLFHRPSARMEFRTVLTNQTSVLEAVKRQPVGMNSVIHQSTAAMESNVASATLQLS